MKVYVAYSKQYPNLPLGVADSPAELASMMHVKLRAVTSSIEKGHNTYRRVVIDEEEQE